MAQELEKQELETADDLLKDISDVKKNMVSKEEYDRVLKDNQKYKHALLTGVTEVVVEPPKPASELKKEYAESIKNGVSNAKGFETALKLREAVINETGNDPFMTEALTKIDPNFGERVAEQLSGILEQSEGDPTMFNAILSRNLR